LTVRVSQGLKHDEAACVHVAKKRDDAGMEGSRRRRPTVIVVGVLVAILVAAFVFVAVSIGGGGGDKAARSGRTKPTRPNVTTTTRGTTQYTVKAGDTLSAIAKQFGVATRAIVDANQIPDPDHLTAGQVLEIPPVKPVRLTVRPRTVAVGGSVEFNLEGAQPGEIITFAIHRPTGTFTGPAHSATEEGTVTTNYTLGLADTPGDYLVTATGDQITSAHAVFRVIVPPTTTTNRSSSRGSVSSTT
jgi:LysM repeat protein